MRHVLLLIGFMLSTAACVQAASLGAEETLPPGGASPQMTADFPGSAAIGRFQLVVVPGHNGSPFLIDTVTGCVWHQVQHQETKRTTFVEVDVENLHWSWGSGAQQLLSRRVDNSSLTEEQKRAMKAEIKKTACGLTNVVLTPMARSASGGE